MLGEGQELMAKMGHVISNRRMAAEIARFKPVFIDPAAVLDGYERWGKLYDDTIHGRFER